MASSGGIRKLTAFFKHTQEAEKGLEEGCGYKLSNPTLCFIFLSARLHAMLSLTNWRPSDQMLEPLRDGFIQTTTPFWSGNTLLKL